METAEIFQNSSLLGYKDGSSITRPSLVERVEGFLNVHASLVCCTSFYLVGPSNGLTRLKFGVLFHAHSLLYIHPFFRITSLLCCEFSPTLHEIVTTLSNDGVSAKKNAKFSLDKPPKLALLSPSIPCFSS